MKKLLTGLTVLGLCAGLLGVSSLLYAADPEPVESTDAQAEQEEDAAWDAWRTDFEARLAVDEEYLAAEEALAGWVGEDDEEYAILEDACARRYREVALVVYEGHFGEWTGTMDEFDEAVAEQPSDFAKSCTKDAIDGCGQGKVCWVKADAKNGICGCACAGPKGECPDYPAASMSTE